jgi:galactokinase/mevalonate kinase-like predicted kinase
VTVVEASAPACVDLAGWPLDHWPLSLFHPAATVVNVAIDRRAWCRVETLPSGIRIESKDTLARTEVRSTAEIGGGGALSLIARVLEAVGIESGMAVVTQLKVPADAGLGGSSSLAVAVAAAAARLRGRDLDPDTLCRLVRDAETRHGGIPAGFGAAATAVRGGVVGVNLGALTPLGERLATDPARVEECLSLFDCGVARTPAAVAGSPVWTAIKGHVEGDERIREALGRIGAGAVGVRESLLCSRYSELTGSLTEEWQARRRLRDEPNLPELDRLMEAALSAGGAARPCRDGRVVAVWAVPDRREAVLGAMRAAGFPPLTCRLDLRGLELE